MLHKLLNLGVPYLVFSIFYLCLNSVVPGVNFSHQLSDILLLWKSPTTQYWFLYALLVLFALFTLLSGTMNNIRITVTLVAVMYLAPAFNVSFGSFGAGLSMALAFGLGASIPSLILDKRSISVKVAVVTIHIIAVGLLVYMDQQDLPAVSEFAQMVGIAASIALISLIVKIRIVERCLLFLAKYSFPIYLLHTIFTSSIRIVLLKLGITDYYVQVAAGIIFGLAVPVVAAMITSKAAVLDFVFYPSKSIKRMRERRTEKVG